MASQRVSVICSVAEPKPIFSDDKYVKKLICGLPGCGAKLRNYPLYHQHLESHECGDCGSYYLDLQHHHCLQAGQRGGHVDRGGHNIDQSVFREVRRAHKGIMKSYYHYFEPDYVNLKLAYESVEQGAERLLEQLLDIHSSLKFDYCAVVWLERDDVIDDELSVVRSDTMYFRSGVHMLLSRDQINSLTWECIDEITNLLSKFIETASQWRVVRVDAFEIKVGEYRLFHVHRPGSYLPMPFKKKRYGVKNMRVTDGRCFEITIARALFHEEELIANKERPAVCKRNSENPKTWEPYLSRLDLTGIDGGVDIHNNLHAFERANNVMISVCTHDNEDVVPLRLSKLEDTENTRKVHLFLIRGARDPITGFINTHFAWIYDFAKFNSRMGSRRKIFFCDICLAKFSSEGKLKEHARKCNNKPSELEYSFPPEGEKLKFKKHAMTLRFPLVAFADFETYTKPVSEENKKATGKSERVAEFSPASFSLVICETIGDEVKIVDGGIEFYSGPDVMNHFFARILWWAEKVLFYIRSTNNKAEPTPGQLAFHEAKNRCDFCDGIFNPEDEEYEEDNINEIERELDDDEIDQMLAATLALDGNPDDLFRCTGRQRKLIKTLHHEHVKTGFDSHLIVKALSCPLINPDDVKVIAKNGEKLISLSVASKDKYVPPLFDPPKDLGKKDKWMCGLRKIRVKISDSMHYLNASLATLVENLKAENHPYFSLMSSIFQSDLLFKDKIIPSAQKLELLQQKVPFPYSYLDEASKLHPKVPVPGRDHFYSDLDDKEISDEEWNVVQRVVQEFQIESFESFLKLYNCLDTIHLAIVFLAFRQQCYKFYNLDICYSNTAAAYSWECFLKMTGAEIEYMREKQMLDFINSGIRGGVSGAGCKIAKSNTQELPDYDPSKAPSVIVSTDIVSLYSFCMENYAFPVGSYEWMSMDELKSVDWLGTDFQNSDRGFIVSVNLEIPDELHNYFSGLPPCPEQRKVLYEFLGESQKEGIDRAGPRGKAYLTQPKLLTTLHNKQNYIVHCVALQFYMKLGIRVTSFNKGVKFRQEKYFQKYIAVNTERRQHCVVDTERSVLKLLNNTIFGRSLQNNKSFLEVKFATCKVRARELLTDPNMKQWKMLTEDLSMFLINPKKVYMNNIPFAGMAILDISKVIFYDAIYNKMKRIWGENLQIVSYDTDGVIIHLLNTSQEQLHNDLVNHREWFDFSKIRKDSLLYKRHASIPDLAKTNASVSGKIKIESDSIVEVVALGSKLYSVLYGNLKEEMKHRGTDKRASKKLTHELYKQVAYDSHKSVTLKSTQIRSVDHQLYKIIVDKVALINFDMYRVYYDPQDINKCLPFGHFMFRDDDDDDDGDESNESVDCEVITID